MVSRMVSRIVVAPGLVSTRKRLSLSHDPLKVSLSLSTSDGVISPSKVSKSSIPTRTLASLADQIQELRLSTTPVGCWGSGSTRGGDGYYALVNYFTRKTRFMKRVTDYFAVIPAKKVAKSPNQDVVNPVSPGTKKMEPKSPDQDSTLKANGKTTTSKPVEKQLVSWNKDQWVTNLSPENRELLDLEIRTMDESWLAHLYRELTKPYFLELKRFLKARRQSNRVFPLAEDVYSWSRLTPLPKVRVLILGQDPYHGVNQAHGLAFSVKPPTRVPPSLINIYKELQSCYPDEFKIPDHGYLEPWARSGVLMLNACLTVDAHSANSHANKGWEQFTEQVIRVALNQNSHIVVMAWGSPAAKRIDKVRPGSQHLILKSVHPSPLSASRGWFGSAHFKKANDWLEKQKRPAVNWCLESLSKK